MQNWKRMQNTRQIDTVKNEVERTGARKENRKKENY